MIIKIKDCLAEIISDYQGLCFVVFLRGMAFKNPLKLLWF